VKLVSRTLSILLALCLCTLAPAAEKSKVASPATEKPPSLSDRFEGLQFRCIGPYRGGRSVAVAGLRGDPLTYYFGGTGGGVWKTTDAGATWENVSDKYFKTGSVGAIAVADSDPNVIYVGMGESPIRGNLSYGDGVWKSVDAGLSWKSQGLSGTRQISRVLVDPDDPDLVYVAALGHAFGPNEERGIFRSRDGGRTWKKVLFVDDKTGASELSMDPLNSRILYAGFWQVVRRPWDLVSGGLGSSLWKSTDGGETWKKVTEDLPEEPWGRVGVAASGAKPGRVYAIIEAKRKGGIYVSDDYGEKWKHVNDEHKIRERAWYYTRVYADPKNPDVLYVPNVELHRSNDGGVTFDHVSVLHGDTHDLWIDPGDSRRMILGDDGGATITFNGGRTWSTQDNQPTAQFYRVATDNRFPFWVYGSQQDNSSVAIPSGVTGQGIDFTDWHSVGGGESGWIAPKGDDFDVVFAGEYGGQITRFDYRTRETREIMAWPQLASGRATRDLKYRFQWNAPILISLHDPNTLYHASQILLRSRDGGETWEEISPDLTRNDKDKQGKSGGPITVDVTGVEVYDTVFALAESPHEKGVIWAGSDDGLVHLTRDGGRSWQNVTPKGLPEWIQINSIEISPHDKASAYVAATMYKLDDLKPYLYKTADYGKSWTRITGGIPEGAFTRVVREDPVRRGLLFAGTETGLYVSFDDGGSWHPFQRNLPAVPITDLTIKDGDLVIATQGRAFWILDDLTPLRLWSGAVESDAAYLFPPLPSYRFQTDPVDEENPPKGVGANMPNGVLINYYLKQKPKKDEIVKLEIISEGKVIRSFSSEKKEPEGDLKEQAKKKEEEKDKDKPLEPKMGINRFLWDMRVFKPVLAPRAVFNEGTKAPPKVGPGTYEVRLSAAGKVLTQPFEVRPRPNGTATAADLKEQFTMLAAIRDQLSENHETLLAVRDVRAQVKDLSERAERLGKGDTLKKRAAPLVAKLTDLELEMTNPEIQADEDDLNFEPKLDHDWVYLAGIVASADRKPTAGSVEYFQVLKKKQEAVLARWQSLLSGDVAEFSRAAEAANLPRIAPAPVIEK
jgi:photosystem II stability/assembly factor-like uncharacterized protein